MTKTTTYSLLVFAILLTIGSYFYIAIPDCLQYRAVCFQSQNVAPYKYRILQPALEHLLAPSDTQDTTLFADFILQALLTPVIIVGLWQWLKRWADDTRALIGVLVFTVVNIASYHFYMRAISTTIEIACVVWALVIIGEHKAVGYVGFTHRPFLAICLLVFIASLNRETGLVIGIIYISELIEYRKHIRLIIPVLIWGITTAAIHIALGTSDHVLGVVGTLEYNWQNIADALFTNALLIPLIIAVAIGYRSSPPTLKCLLWVTALYCGAVIIGGAWNETMRLLLPVLPIALPAVMYKPAEVAARNENVITLDRAPARGEVVSVRYTRYTVDFGEN